MHNDETKALRDAIAIAVLAGIAARTDYDDNSYEERVALEGMAAFAYRLADAMLAKRAAAEGAVK